MKEVQNHVYFGIKTLKNSLTYQFFKHSWTIIKSYWKQSKVPENFIKSFENEYVEKPVEWHYGCAFPGKSRTNNSLESANRVLKDHFGRKAHNIKEFIAKLKDFFRELSSKEKTNFPQEFDYDKKIKKEAEAIVINKDFLTHEGTGDLIFYYPRKGIDKNQLQAKLNKHVARPELPKDINHIFDCWGNFRSLDKIIGVCNCSYYAKYAYCKHSLALQIMEGSMNDPQLKKKKTPGRKPLLKKALEK